MIGHNQNPILVDEPLPTSELFALLRQGQDVKVNGETINLAQLTDSISEEDKTEAMEISVTSNGAAIYELYIKTIEEW